MSSCDYEIKLCYGSSLIEIDLREHFVRDRNLPSFAINQPLFCPRLTRSRQLRCR